MRDKPIELTETEWSIIKAVWEHEPATAPQIQGKLEKQTEWTYSTVRTMMDRMVVKGLLCAEKVRNLTWYRSAITQDQAQRGEIFYTLKNAFNGALTPMVQCLLQSKKLSADEISELERLIQETKNNSRK